MSFGRVSIKCVVLAGGVSLLSGCMGSSGADVDVPDDVAAVVEERIAEVRRARLLDALDESDPSGYRRLLQAAREGTPYEQFVAIRKLGDAPNGIADLERLAGVLQDAQPRLADLCRALVLATKAERASGPDERDAIYLAGLRESTTPFVTQMLGTLYLERSDGEPSEEVCRAAGLARADEASGLVLYHGLRSEGEDGGAQVARLLDVLQGSVLPAGKNDPSFPARAQAATAALIDGGGSVARALVERYGDGPPPKTAREYLTLLYVVDVLQSAPDPAALTLLRRLRDVAPPTETLRRTIAMHRDGVFDLRRAAMVAEIWVESGERYPYHDWLAGWYRWFVVAG